MTNSKCGEVTFCTQVGKRVYVLNCIYCSQICLQWEMFINHLEQEHNGNLNFEPIIQPETSKMPIKMEIPEIITDEPSASVHINKKQKMLDESLPSSSAFDDPLESENSTSEMCLESSIKVEQEEECLPNLNLFETEDNSSEMTSVQYTIHFPDLMEQTHFSDFMEQNSSSDQHQEFAFINEEQDSRLKKRRESASVRRQRLKQDPAAYKLYLQKAREQNKRRKKEGKLKLLDQLSDEEKEKRREKQKMYRQKLWEQRKELAKHDPEEHKRLMEKKREAARLRRQRIKQDPAAYELYLQKARDRMERRRKKKKGWTTN